MESAGISRLAAKSGCENVPSESLFLSFFFLISLPPILWSIHLTLLGLFGSFLAQRGPALKRQLSRAIVVSLLRVQSWPFKPSENYTGSIFFARSRVIHLSTISLSLSLEGWTVCHSAGLTQVFNVPYVIQPCIGQRVMEMSANRPQMEWSRCV